VSPASSLRRFSDAIERHPGVTIVGIGVVLALAYGGAVCFFPKPDGRVVVGDAVHYFVYLRSLVFDHDLQFHNDYVRLYGLTHPVPGVAWIYQPLPTGYIRNVMPVGPALAWAPLYLLVAAVVALLRVFGIDYPLDGFAPVFQASAGISGIAAATAGAWLSYRMAARLFDPRAALWATLAIWLGASPLYYSLVSPTYSHAVSMLANATVFFVWMNTRDRQDVSRFAVLGGLTGLAALVRWQDATLLALPALDAAALVFQGRSGPLERVRDAALRLAAAGIAALIAFSPQLIVWQIIFGRPFLIPQGGEFMRWGDAALVAVLFSDYHGLFTWTPIVALAVAGFVPLWRRDARVGGAIVLLFILAWYTNAAVADWWAGEAFGSRRFVSCVPLFVLGLSALFAGEWWRRWMIPIVVVTVGLNGLLLFQYQLFLKGVRDIAPYPTGAYGLLLARFVVPFRFMAQWLGYS
jgi:hypothetical protein